MKLTKAQRLFIKAGRMETMINGLAYKIQKHPFSTAISGSQSVLKRMRRQRKQLIREALDAYETERLVAQASAYERGFCAGRRINNTTKTQHT